MYLYPIKDQIVLFSLYSTLFIKCFTWELVLFPPFIFTCRVFILSILQFLFIYFFLNFILSTLYIYTVVLNFSHRHLFIQCVCLTILQNWHFCVFCCQNYNILPWFLSLSFYEPFFFWVFPLLISKLSLYRKVFCFCLF